jgi:hypothetical protein
MSVRTVFDRYDPRKLAAALGSKDAKFLELVLAELEDLDWEDEGYDEDPAPIARRAVYEGVPFAGLGRENVSHASAADAIASAVTGKAGQKRPAMTAGYEIKHFYWLDLIEEVERKVSGADLRLLQMVYDGKPLFGREPAEGDGRGYGFFTVEETQALHALFTRLLAADVELAGELIEDEDENAVKYLEKILRDGDALLLRFS